MHPRSLPSALVCLALAARAAAAKIDVNATGDLLADDGACTLREAVIAANTDAASGSIRESAIRATGTM